MAFSLTQDIRSVTELKKNTKKVIDQAHATGRPIVITVNGKPDMVLIDAKVFEEHVQAKNLVLLLDPAEKEVAAKKTRPIRSFLKEFKNAKKISR